MAQRLDKTVLLPEAHFILEADLDRARRRKFAHGLRNTSGKVFLNAMIACASSSPYWVLAAVATALACGREHQRLRIWRSGVRISSGAHIRYGRARRTWPILRSTMPDAHREPLQYGYAGAPLLYRCRTGRQIRDRHLGELDECPVIRVGTQILTALNGQAPGTIESLERGGII